MWCVMKILLIPFFIVSFFTAAKAAIMEKCSYETDDLWIKIINLCEEGEMSCDKMVYIGLNKKTGDYKVENLLFLKVIIVFYIMSL